MVSTAHRHSSPSRHERVPASLQSVFLNSNRGKEVSKPPPEKIAQKVYEGNWVFRRAETETKKTYEHSKDKVLTKNKKSKKNSTVDKSSSDKNKKTGRKKKEQVDYTLQEYFDALIQERGYSLPLYNTLETGYYNKATELQIASYGPRMVQIVRSSDVHALRETMDGGLSPNPCNRFGESLLHMVCRRGDAALLQVMIDAGACLQVSDDYGRTPLHDACWAANPAFDVVTMVLKRDSFMFFMKDKRGSLPLSYVPKADWPEYREWLDENIDHFFPESNVEKYAPTDLTSMAPNSIPLPEHKTELSLELIKMVANGDLSPREARIMAETARREEDEETVADTLTSEDDYDSDFDSDYDSDDYDSDIDSECGDFGGMGADDMLEMLRMAQAASK